MSKKYRVVVEFETTLKPHESAGTFVKNRLSGMGIDNSVMPYGSIEIVDETEVMTK